MPAKRAELINRKRIHYLRIKAEKTLDIMRLHPHNPHPLILTRIFLGVPTWLTSSLLRNVPYNRRSVANTTLAVDL
ncbi:MAG: hypothetical protein ACJAV1_002131 [Paraglaciecola sp.]|jgi:hypothetical protein